MKYIENNVITPTPPAITTLRVLTTTRDKLKELGTMNETVDGLICRLINESKSWSFLYESVRIQRLKDFAFISENLNDSEKIKNYIQTELNKINEADNEGEIINI